MSPVVKNQEIQLYDLQVETLQPFRIGANVDPMSDIEGPVTMLGGQVVIQGASLKGALRAQIEEYLILNYESQSAMKPCIPAPRNNLSADEARLIQDHKYKPGGNCAYDYRNRKERVQLCPACYLLGTMGLVGFIQVPYLYLESEVDVEEMYANRRDRGSNRVADGANRSIQLLPKATVFTGQLEVIVEDRLRGWTLGSARPLGAQMYSDEWLKTDGWTQERVLRELIVDRLTCITRLGGQISKGFGNVCVKVKDAGRKQV